MLTTELMSLALAEADREHSNTPKHTSGVLVEARSVDRFDGSVETTCVWWEVDWLPNEEREYFRADIYLLEVYSRFIARPAGDRVALEWEDGDLVGSIDTDFFGGPIDRRVSTFLTENVLTPVREGDPDPETLFEDWGADLYVEHHAEALVLEHERGEPVLDPVILKWLERQVGRELVVRSE